MVAPIFGGMIWAILVGLFALVLAAWPVVSRWLREAALVALCMLGIAVGLVAWRSERRLKRKLAEVEERRRQ